MKPAMPAAPRRPPVERTEHPSQQTERPLRYAERVPRYAERTPRYAERVVQHAERVPQYAERVLQYAERVLQWMQSRRASMRTSDTSNTRYLNAIEDERIDASHKPNNKRPIHDVPRPTPRL